MPYLTVCKAGDVPDRDMLAFNIGGQEVAITRIGDRFYAFDNHCTHRQDYMTNGFLTGETVICSFHDAIFSLKDGAVLGGPAWDPLPLFNVRIEGDDLQVEWQYDLPPDSITPVDIDDEEHRYEREFII